MPPENKSYVDVDALMPRVTLEQVAALYGVSLPDCKRVGSETRTACFLACGKAHPTGDRALAFQLDDPAKKWKCHQYGCDKGGNLVSLADLLKPGPSAGGRPRGDRFKQIAADLRSIVEGTAVPMSPVHAPVPAAPPAPRENVPLARSENERARGLTTLDRKFVVDVAAMAPKAAAYIRRRPFLSPEAFVAWRAGYLPRDSGGEDKSGGTMRGKIVYCYESEEGEVLTWFGRDPEFEDKHAAWEGTDKKEREPEKFHFVKGFHRGLELFGQQRLRKPEAAETLQRLGVVLVEGPNDVIRLSTLGVAAVGLCSNTITREQAAKAARLARELGKGIVTVFLDCDSEGENGMKQCLGYLAQLCPVRLAWTSKMYGGKFKDRQPESLLVNEWQEIQEYLATGNGIGWKLD